MASIELSANKNTIIVISGGVLASVASMAIASSAEAKTLVSSPESSAPKAVYIIDPFQSVSKSITSIGRAITLKSHAVLQLTPVQEAERDVTPEERAEWDRVNVCEEGGNWHVEGAVYSGGLGISNENWIAYGGRQFSSSAAFATPDEQIVVAMRIQSYAPDQGGCSDW
jgi:hypothetical protein